MTELTATANATTQRPCPARPGFTLVELLVTLAILAVLLSVLLPAFASARNEARAFVCMDHLRAAAFEFRLFADPKTATFRGDSEKYFGERFDATDFLESLYETGEFWRDDSAHIYDRQPYRPNQKPIICPAGPRGLYRVHGIPELSKGAVAPLEKVSFALNRRLSYAPVSLPNVPFPLQRFVTVSKRVLDHPSVPLIFDVDAEAAIKAQEEPFFSAPPDQQSDKPTVYDGNRYWFPAFRHNKRFSVSFVGGHVVSTSKPLSDPTWDWDYHPQVSGP